MTDVRYFGSDDETRSEAQDRAAVVLAAVDWARIKKRLDDTVFEVLETLQYHVEESVASDASFNLAGRAQRRARDIVDALIKGDSKLAEEIFGREHAKEARAQILAANEALITYGALGDAKKEIERLQQVIESQNRRITGREW